MSFLPKPQPSVPHDEPPPFLGTWRRVYGSVLIYLAALIAVFYIFGAVFTP